MCEQCSELDSVSGTVESGIFPGIEGGRIRFPKLCRPENRNFRANAGISALALPEKYGSSGYAASKLEIGADISVPSG